MFEHQWDLKWKCVVAPKHEDEESRQAIGHLEHAKGILSSKSVNSIQYFKYIMR